MLVGKVHRGSPAEAAGIEVGDVIVALDARPIDRQSEMGRWIRGAAGGTLEVELVRDGRTIRVDAAIPAYAEP